MRIIHKMNVFKSLKSLTLIQCLVMCFARKSSGLSETGTLKHRGDVVLTGRVHHSHGAGRDEGDFYRYYTRALEDNVWGSPLPRDAAIPRSGLGVFMILWTNDSEESRAKFKRCLQSLDVHFNDRFNYPVIVLHQDLSQATVDEVRTWTRSRIQFIGDALLDREYEAKFNRTGHKMFDWYPEYLHMIRTNIYRWPLHRAFFGYRYVFKLDSDAAIVEPVEFDVFEDLMRRDIKAAYFASVVDHAFVCENLYETAEDVLRYNQLEPMQGLSRMPKYWTWYGFAFVFDTAFARSPAYLNTAWHFDNVHGAFRYRWGDPHLYILTSMFLRESQTAQLPVPFQHQGLCANVKDNASCQKEIVWRAESIMIRRHHRRNASAQEWFWSPREPFRWSKDLWKVDPTDHPPYSSSKH